MGCRFAVNRFVDGFAVGQPGPGPEWRGGSGVWPGYYDNTNFHRNIKGFIMIQAGSWVAHQCRRYPQKMYQNVVSMVHVCLFGSVIPLENISNMGQVCRCWEIRCQGGDPTGTGKGGQSIYGGYFEDTGRPVDGRRIEEESEIWESSYNSTVVVDFIRKTCIYECPDPQHSGAWTRGTTFQPEDEFVSTLKHERRGVASVSFFLYVLNDGIVGRTPLDFFEGIYIFGDSNLVFANAAHKDAGLLTLFCLLGDG